MQERGLPPCISAYNQTAQNTVTAQFFGVNDAFMARENRSKRTKVRGNPQKRNSQRGWLRLFQRLFGSGVNTTSGMTRRNLIRNAWDETVRVIASMEERIVSPSLMLHRLGSYARQNSVYQALSEIGRVQKTIHILKTIDDEEYRRRMSRELNKGEASHGKEGAMRGREFGDQLHTFSCLSILHNTVVARNTMQIGKIVSQLRGEGHQIEDETLSHVTPLLRKHIGISKTERHVCKQGQPYKPFLISRMQVAIAAPWSSKIRCHRPSQTIAKTASILRKRTCDSVS
jgi:hypothetical protein